MAGEGMRAPLSYFDATDLLAQHHSSDQRNWNAIAKLSKGFLDLRRHVPPVESLVGGLESPELERFGE